MNLKVKLIEKDTQQETSDPMVLHSLRKKIRKIVEDEFPQYTPIVNIYGQVVLFEDN